jgi:hypothetical protein
MSREVGLGASTYKFVAEDGCRCGKRVEGAAQPLIVDQAAPQAKGMFSCRKTFAPTVILGKNDLKIGALSGEYLGVPIEVFLACGAG